jgi:hypothetical protein
MFSISNQERISKFMRRFEKMILVYFMQPYERNQPLKLSKQSKEKFKTEFELNLDQCLEAANKRTKKSIRKL